LLGAGTLKDLALALFVGIAAGTYSSVFIATPLLCDLKEREPAMRALARRVEQRRRSTEDVGPAATREPAAIGAGPGAAAPARPASRPSPRKAVQASPRSGQARAQPQRKTRSSRKSKGRRR
jgi:preprotein translocase subunit SecF